MALFCYWPWQRSGNGFGGSVKGIVWRKVMEGTVICTAKDMAKVADMAFTKILVIYL